MNYLTLLLCYIFTNVTKTFCVDLLHCLIDNFLEVVYHVIEVKFQKTIIEISKSISITKTNKNNNYRIKVFSNAVIHARRSTLETANQK